MERLTDNQLIDLATAVRDERCVACEGRGLVPVSKECSVDCAMCAGKGIFALKTEVMLVIIAELLVYRGVLPTESTDG